MSAAVAAIILAVLGAWALLGRPSASRPAASGEARHTATVQRRDFVRTLRLAGTVEAVASKPIAAPRLAGQNLGTLVITRLVPNGTALKRGDVLVEFDRQDQIRNALDRQADYRDLLNQIEKMNATQAAARAHDDTELKQAEDRVETASLEMKKNQVISKIDAEKNQENLDEARARLKQLRETYALKRRAAQAELRVLEIQRDRALHAMRHAQENADKMIIHAPLDGLVVLNTIWKGGQMGEIQEGDEIRAGVPFLQVVDPRAMQARVRANQEDVPYLRAGQPVQVRLDAYPDLIFTGRLEQIGAIAVPSGFSQKLRTFTAIFSMSGSNPKLLPDLSAAVDVELERVPDVLVLPRDAVLTEGRKSYVRVARGNSYEQRTVTLGEMDDTHTIVQSGIEAGAVVLRGPWPENSAK